MNSDVDLAMALMAVPGPTAHEGAISEALRKRLTDMGVPERCIRYDKAYEQSEAGGEIGNLVVCLDGHGRGERRLLSTHMDTVREAEGSRPRIEGARVVNAAPGRALGADARAGCACLLAAIRALMETGGNHGPRTFVFFVQEEIGLVGSRGLDVGLLGDPFPTMAFNFDGSRPDELVRAVVGVERLILDVQGVPAHASRPREGISAALIAARALAKIEEDGWNGAIEKPEGVGTANIGVLQGGTGSNVVMASLSGLMEARSFDRVFRGAIVEAWKQAFMDSAAVSNRLGANLESKASVSFEPGPEYAPYRLADDAPVVTAAVQAMKACGLEPVLTEHWGGMDCNNIVAKGIPAVGTGTGGHHAHSVKEYLDIPEFSRACALAVHLALAGSP